MLVITYNRKKLFQQPRTKFKIMNLVKYKSTVYEKDALSSLRHIFFSSILAFLRSEAKDFILNHRHGKMVLKAFL